MSGSAERAIAIVGVGAIFPDAPTPDRFWDNIVDKRYSIIETPPDRWSIADYYDPDVNAPDKTYSKIGGWVRDFQFDWKRFRIPPKVAASMDAGQQWAVTLADQALNDYGYPQRPLNTERTAVILGTAMGGEAHYTSHLRITYPEYARALRAVESFSSLPQPVQQSILDDWRGQIAGSYPPVTEDSMPGELANIVSGRVSNVFNLRGPSFITDAACAASLAAVQAAVELLNRGEVDAVLTGGVDHNMNVSAFVKFCKIGALSATGTRPFGDGADGFVMGEGAGVFLLKRLADAERDGDRIYALIRGIGGSSDGKGKGITAPNPVGQRLAMQRAWEDAGLDPADATLIEAHGTSTRIGDVVEVESLAEIFASAPAGSIALGSIKSNIGHLKSAAGAAGLMKATLAISNRVLPPTLNAERPNPNIDFAQTPFYLNQEARQWSTSNGRPRCCAVSAYGFGGTNFHLVLEEHIPGRLTRSEPSRSFAATSPAHKPAAEVAAPAQPAPLRPLLALGARSPEELKNRLIDTVQQVEAGWLPPLQTPDPAAVGAAERLVVDFGDSTELVDRLKKALKGFELDAPSAWTALQAQGIFRGSGRPAGKIAFLFPGQGSQYLNMGRQLVERCPDAAEVFDQADRVMTPILGRPLRDFIFTDSQDPTELAMAELALMQTAICQPAMLTMDIALFRLLEQYGFRPEMSMGHSLGEYAALISSESMPFEDALEAVAARGREMEAFSVEDNGWMAAVMAPYAEVERILGQVDGYVVAANINSYNQCVIGGASEAVEAAMLAFQEGGYQAKRIPVSHAFHTRIVAPAGAPLRKVLNRLRVYSPNVPLISNVTGEFYPTEPDRIRDLLEQQVASPVQWIKGLETLYAAGARTFVEVGPKKALKGLVDDVLAGKPGLVSLFSNHPKVGEIPTFNQALCGLYSAGYAMPRDEAAPPAAEVWSEGRPSEVAVSTLQPVAKTPAGLPGGNGHFTVNEERVMSTQLDRERVIHTDSRTAPEYELQPPAAQPFGSVVISGTGLGLPGAEKAIMDPDNAVRILRGEQLIDLIPERFRNKMLAKRITRLVKSEDGDGSFETITQSDDVIKLAGRPGAFDPVVEYGLPARLVEALDTTTQLAIAAGLDALREAGIPLVQSYRRTTTGKDLPDRWMLPEPMRDETGVIFASAFPGFARFADEIERYYNWQNRLDQLKALEELRAFCDDPALLGEIDRRIAGLRSSLVEQPYVFDRQFLFRVLSMGHSQFAEYIGARGPNAQVNVACASTTMAVSLAEDWIRSGRCRRVIVIGADNVTSDALLAWFGAGFLAAGAAATEDSIEEAVLPFDKRRHGLVMGMGACGLVVESEDAVRERGMRGIVELLHSESRNSAFHGSRLDVDHIAEVMDTLITTAEQRFGLHRSYIAAQTVFVSHETYTPARGGSASAEIAALRHTFGEAAGEVIITNTKGFTGHAMGAGVEDVIAVKILEHGIVPPVPNHREIDPALGVLNLSRGGRYPVQFALRLAAGFGSQIALTLTRRIPGNIDRIENRQRYRYWLEAVSGVDRAETVVERRVLRIAAVDASARAPAPSAWQPGRGPTLRAPAAAVNTGAGVLRLRELRPAPEPIVPIETAPKPGPASAAAAPAPVVDLPPASRREAFAPEAPPSAVAQTVEAAATVVEPPAAPAAVPPVTPSVDPVAERILAIVGEKTGYPREMLELDLDMEADLGIDTVKQAETFLAIREAFDIPAQQNLQLRNYPTLAHAIGFVYAMRPDLAAAVTSNDNAVEARLTEAAAIEPPAAAAVDPVAERILAIVGEKTGYPREMLELDLDMEADLGIDTVKQAETFLAIREAFDIPAQQNLQLRNYPTLAHAIGFVYAMRPDLAPLPAGAASEVESLSAEQLVQPMDAQAAAAGIPAAAQVEVAPSAAPAADPIADPVAERILAVVAEKTGYPVEMLELDLDMEADLGIDTVKQAETLLAIRTEFNIPRRDDLKLRDYPTLEKVIEFVYAMRPDLASARETVAGGEAQSSESAPEEPSLLMASAPSPPRYILKDADRYPRRVPIPVLQPGTELFRPSAVTLDSSSRVVVMPDQGGVAAALIGRLQADGVQVLELDPDADTDSAVAQVQAWNADGKVQGLYWLSALDVEPSLNEMDLAAWRSALNLRVKRLFRVMQALYTAIEAPETFLIAGARMGGLHGYAVDGATAPMGGAVSGFLKAYSREHPQALVKTVDFELASEADELAQALIAETLSAPGVTEIGYHDRRRFAIGLEDRQLETAEANMLLDQETVFVVTGAAGGITSEIVADLAVHSGAAFYLLDLIDHPDPADPDLVLYRRDPDALRELLAERIKASGKRATPVKIEKTVQLLQRQAALLDAIAAVEAAGGQAHYFALDLRQPQAVSAVFDEIHTRHGRIDVLIHAAGVEISRSLPDKDADQFDLVFDVKADGFFNLLKAAQGMPVGTAVVFSSIAGRFGNAGQADYCAANDLLCKLTACLPHLRPGTRGLALDWTAWQGIGMASRGSIPWLMELAGIEMLPPECGVPTVRRELTRSDGAAEVVVAGRLGLLLDAGSTAGEPDLAALNAVLETQRSQFGLLGEICAASPVSGLQIAAELDPQQQPFLYDHRIAGMPVLPGVMGLEIFAQAGLWAAQTFTGGRMHVTGLERVAFLRPFKFYRDAPQTLYLELRLLRVQDGDLIARARLVSKRALAHADLPPQEKLHFTADVRLSERPQPLETVPTELPGVEGEPVLTSDIYSVYFHGPAFQVLENVQVAKDQAVGLWNSSLPPYTHPAESQATTAPRALEACFQTAGMWELKRLNRFALPLAIDRVTIFEQPKEPGDGYAAVEALDGGAAFNAVFADGAGRVYLRLEGYRTVALPAEAGVKTEQ